MKPILKLMIVVVFFALLLLAATGCSSFDGKGSSDATSSYTDSVDEAFFTEVKKITLSQLQSVNQGDTYREVIAKIGTGKDFNQYDSDNENSAEYIYLVDETYLFCLRFESLDDISEKSGKDYTEDLIPAFFPSELSEYKKQGYLYGVLIGDSLVCVGNADGEHYILNEYDAELSFLNKTPASVDDLTGLNGLLVKVDRIMETYPPQLVANEIIIVE